MAFKYRRPTDKVYLYYYAMPIPASNVPYPYSVYVEVNQRSFVFFISCPY